jgi:UDP-N-acetylglucosamine 2-epimerase
LVDRKAKELAIESGIEEQKIVVFGNPYHSFLKEWKPRISRSELYQQLGLTDTKKGIVLYAPDPLSNVDGNIQFGFDEVSATKELAEIIKDCCDSFYFLLNPHPNQIVERLNDAVNNCISILPKGTDVNELIYYSSIVVGFFSNLLLEAVVMNKPVLRFFPRPGLFDPLEGTNTGEIVYPETISQKIKSFL